MYKKSVLFVIGLFFLLTASGVAQVEAQISNLARPKPTIVIVHGAWGGGWADIKDLGEGGKGKG